MVKSHQIFYNIGFRDLTLTPLGGIDTEHDGFKCTDDGILDTPAGMDNGEPWPVCKEQQGMVISAAELMLDRFDRRISDRYKLIDYREEDNQKNIVHLSNYFLEVTLPVICGEILKALKLPIKR